MAASPARRQRAPRRSWPLSEKRRIVELTLREGASISAIAREQGIHPTSLCHWRTRYHAGELMARPAPRRKARASAASAHFLPVTIAPSADRTQPGSACVGSTVHMMFASGATLRIETAALDVALVCALVAELAR